MAMKLEEYRKKNIETGDEARLLYRKLKAHKARLFRLLRDFEDLLYKADGTTYRCAYWSKRKVKP